VTDRPIIFSSSMVRALLEGRKTQTRRLATSPLRHCVPGDRLYVRESFAYVGGCDPGFLTFMATYPDDLPAHVEGRPATIQEGGYRWTPSIHMPRKISRMTLTVTATMVQRLQDIGEADALAEGCHRGQATGRIFDAPGSSHLGPAWASARDWYADLWESLHGADSWEANPEVVALTFTVDRRNIDAEAPS